MGDIWMVYGRYMDGIWQVNTGHRQDRPSRPDADARIRNQLLTWKDELILRKYNSYKTRVTKL